MISPSFSLVKQQIVSLAILLTGRSAEYCGPYGDGQGEGCVTRLGRRRIRARQRFVDIPPGEDRQGDQGEDGEHGRGDQAVHEQGLFDFVGDERLGGGLHLQVGVAVEADGEVEEFEHDQRQHHAGADCHDALAPEFHPQQPDAAGEEGEAEDGHEHQIQHRGQVFERRHVGIDVFGVELAGVDEEGKQARAEEDEADVAEREAEIAEQAEHFGPVLAGPDGGSALSHEARGMML
jgi:hypothetical protein